MTDILHPQAPTERASCGDVTLPPASVLFARDMLQRGEPRPRTAAADCHQDLGLTVYFDGTGNNREIDVPTFEHSNVARLYRAMPKNSDAAGEYSFYVPGVGTPFREIGDPGGALGKGIAVGGEARIQWAMDQVEFRIEQAAAKAQNPVNKIRSINVAVFGFSRGAATARAFARRFADKCTRTGNGWVWKNGQYPTRLYFMGLFDTVAAVGTPTSLRKYAGTATQAGDISPVLAVPAALAVYFTSTADGHGAWASDLRIPDMVERCVHYCSAHEMRNSFPLDTTIEDGHYPPNCHEVFYPGVHSNVGGGYRPGEGGRNTNRFAMLNLVPLNAMYREAVKAGVPLRSLDSLPDQFKDDFSPFTPDAAQARDLLNTRFNHYMNTVGWGGKSVGHTVRDHMTMYFRWRIVHVGQKILARRRHEPGWEAQRLADYDRQLAPERAAKQAEMYRLDHEYAAAIDARGRAFERMRVSASADPQELRSAYHQAAAHAEQVRWARIDQRSTLDTLPEPAPVLNAALESYDQQFLDDSDRVRGAERLSLTPFESILREAWETAPLTDAQVIAFFDEYVTDSLAGFDQDRTRATDFRWLYQGGDATVMYGDDSPEAQARRAREAAMAKQRAQWDLEAREYGWMR